MRLRSVLAAIAYICKPIITYYVLIVNGGDWCYSKLYRTMKNKVLNWIIVIVGIIMIINLTRSILDLWQRDSIVEEAETRVAEAEVENARLREKYREVRQNSYIEKVAREKLGMVKEGEVIVVLPNKDQIRDSRLEIREEEKKNVKEAAWWWQLVGIFL